MAIDDLDGDGDVDDAFFTPHYADYAVACFRDASDGMPEFDCQEFSVDSGSCRGRTHDGETVALADLDGDGDVDAVAGYDQCENVVWFNNGRDADCAGAFSDRGIRLGDMSTDTHDIALHDFNGDGYIDAFVANDEGGNDTPTNELWFLLPVDE